MRQTCRERGHSIKRRTQTEAYLPLNRLLSDKRVKRKCVTKQLLHYQKYTLMSNFIRSDSKLSLTSIRNKSSKKFQQFFWHPKCQKFVVENFRHTEMQVDLCPLFRCAKSFFNLKVWLEIAGLKIVSSYSFYFECKCTLSGQCHSG